MLGMKTRSAFKISQVSLEISMFAVIGLLSYNSRMVHETEEFRRTISRDPNMKTFIPALLF